MRRKLLSALIAFSVVFCSLTPYVFAQNATVNASYVNMRSGPGVGYSVINCLAKGTSVNVENTDNSEWYAISYNGQTGYMSSQYITLSSVSDSAGTVSSTSGLMTADEYDAYAASVTPTPISTPTPTATDDTGYSLYDLFLANPTPAPTVIPAVTPTPYYEADVTSVSESTPTPSVVSNTDAELYSAGTIGTISGDYVRFRTGPGTTYTIITMYSRGQTVSILGLEGDWVKCTINGRDGYVSKTYVKLSSQDDSSSDSSHEIESITSPSSQSSTGTSDSLSTESSSTYTSTAGTVGYISGNNVRFRTAASLNSDIIKEFYFGNSIEITGTDGEWTAVTSDGESGYVYSQYVKEGSYTSTVESSSDTVVSSNISGSDVVNYAMQYLGTNYKYGGQDPSTGFDCSGFVYYVYGHFGISLNRTAEGQSLNGTTVSAADLQPGDILCFYTSGSSIGHSGIYIGDNKFIHSANSNTGVIITQLSGYYADRGFVAKRVI